MHWTSHQRRAQGGLWLGLLLQALWAGCGEGARHAVERSASGRWRGELVAPASGPQLNALHAWGLRLERADGRPVAAAIIRVEGGMPEHDHGLPTDPQATASGGAGEYRIEGVRFHMPGLWRLVFDIQAEGERDVLTFELVVP